MAKAAIARIYVIQYTIPGVDENTRNMVVRARFPVRELARFRQLNPKASVVRMYDKHSGAEIVIDDTPSDRKLSEPA